MDSHAQLGARNNVPPQLRLSSARRGSTSRTDMSRPCASSSACGGRLSSEIAISRRDRAPILVGSWRILIRRVVLRCPALTATLASMSAPIRSGAGFSVGEPVRMASAGGAFESLQGSNTCPPLQHSLRGGHSLPHQTYPRPHHSASVLRANFGGQAKQVPQRPSVCSQCRCQISPASGDKGNAPTRYARRATYGVLPVSGDKGNALTRYTRRATYGVLPASGETGALPSLSGYRSVHRRVEELRRHRVV